MLPKFYFDTDDNVSDVKIRKFAGAEDVSHLGALPYGTAITIEISVSRRLGASGVVLRVCRDGENDNDIPLDFCRSDNKCDVYSCSLETVKLCGEEKEGLFYYEFLFLRGEHTAFTDSYNNYDFHLSERPGDRFRLLVYKEDFKTPESFGKGVMYQIFTDRFYKGDADRAIAVKDGAVIDPDWKNGVPQFASVPGEPLKNNVFFGGNLWGVADKLEYLKELGVTYIYLNPIFEAYSNHKYDTSNYEKVDEMFGGDEALDNLLEKAREKGVGIILDGVFNHTGDDSIYFNRYGNYGEGGAYRDPESPFAKWYNFKEYPGKYESWWGIEIHPKLNHENEDCRRYFTGDDGIIRKYIRKGIAGWRLDVADELSDEFLDELRVAAKDESNGDAIIIGEVWENAADKISYGKRRRYFRGDQLDSVMNYPLKNAIVGFCQWGDGEMLYNTLTEIYSSYPTRVSHKLMNLLGTHDTDRILTVLGRDENDEFLSNAEKAGKKLSKDQLSHGIDMLKIASVLQFTAYGIPCVYYGDEIGLEGYGDPFCRMPFPWHKLGDRHRVEIFEHYKTLGRIRNQEKALEGGHFYVLKRAESSIVFVRENGDERILVCANRGPDFELGIPDGVIYRDLLDNKEYNGGVTVRSDSAMILKEIKK